MNDFLIKEKSMCCGCMACVNVCPQKCIYVETDSEGFEYPKIDKNVCINCGLCKKVCPINMKLETEISKDILNNDAENMNLTFAAINKDEKIRMKSSSGGIFSALAEEIISNGGIVFGAAFTSDYESVHHIRIDSIEELDKLRGSKYLQSKVQNIYKQVKVELENGINVMFTGTPCEVEGLKSYLDVVNCRNKENLFLVDFICHGVPSPKLWKKYIQFGKSKINSEIKKISFRNKNFGWKQYATQIEYSNGKKYCKKHFYDKYMNMFLQDLCLRPSCYECQFKKRNRVSNITLADFWGSQKVLPEFDDDKGLSLVFIHDSKGKNLIESLSDKVDLRVVDDEEVILYNPSMIKSVNKPDKRDEFMKHIDDMGINQLYKHYVYRVSWIKKLYRKMKQIIKFGNS